MEQQNKVSKKKTLIIVSILILITIIGVTFAYFSSQGESSKQTVTTAYLSIEFDDSTPIINAEKIRPILEKDIETKAAKKVFKVSKKSDSPNVYAKIELTDLTIPEVLSVSDFKWALYKNNSKISTGDFDGITNSDTVILATNELIADEEIEYTLYIWINETKQLQNDMMNQTFEATITVSGSESETN